jgi:2-polyprenyl-6-hydroxyphenyl methylase / 3-demethylubiquinone-9 3-methyltransferase
MRDVHKEDHNRHRPQKTVNACFFLLRLPQPFAAARQMLRSAVTTCTAAHRRTLAAALRCSFSSASINPAELDKFRHIRDQWWDPSSTAGSGPLHAMNILRTRFIADSVRGSSSSSSKIGKPLQDLRCLDVGCGGGLLSESLARLGGQVTGIDPSAENVAVAAQHAQGDPLTRSTLYEAATAEELVERGEQFDVVCALEVVEHVNNVGDFVGTLCELVRPGGHLVMSTLNRTPKVYTHFAIALSCINF